MPNLSIKYPFFPMLSAIMLALPGSAGAVTLTTLKGMGLEGSYGSYAPRGDCSQGVRLTISESGLNRPGIAGGHLV
ncbi:hypothetical protein ACQKO5_21885 [Novosphingobium subterraneum]|uniref:hypothetical protein n=1 Tax=Novosphingobium subterraneum TaxID=48936 RepID=UPI003CFBEE32